MQSKISTNPYDILEVSRLASDAEIAKAFVVAMKARKYSPDEIAKARKCLMNPAERIIADYLSPVLPAVNRFRSKISQSEERIEERLTPAQIDRAIDIEIDKLVRVDREREIDRELANLVWEL